MARIPNLTPLGATSGIVWSAAGQIIVALCSFGSLRFYTELLSKEDFGRAMIATGLLSLLDGVLVLALNQSLIPLCAAQLEHSDARAAARLAMQIAYWLWLRVSLVIAPAAIVGAGFAWTQADWLWVGPTFVVIYLGEEFLKVAQTAPLAARQAYADFSIWVSCEAIVGVVATTTLLGLWRADVIGFLAGLMLARLLTTVAFSIWHGASSLLVAAQIPPSPEIITATLAQGRALSALAPLGWITNFLDRYAVASLAGLAAGGVYGAAAGLAARPYGLLTAILTQYFRPRLYSHEYFRRQTLILWMIAASGLGLGGVIVMAYFGDQLIALALAPDFRANVKPILIALCLAQSCAILCHALDNALIARRLSGALFGAQSLGVIAVCLLTPLGAILGGGLGAALGRLIAEVAKLASVATVLARRRAQASPHSQSSIGASQAIIEATP